MSVTELTNDELLTTTRAVRKRLNFDKPVPLELIKECLDIALQAPSGGNTQNWHFIVVTEPKKRLALADLYRRGWDNYKQAAGSVFDLATSEPAGARKDQLGRVAKSADYLAENMEKAPVYVIPCIQGRTDEVTGPMANIICASTYGSIIPATWSYMLAARSRGLGTAWTTCHLMFESEAAEILGVPYEEITQTALIPTAFYTGETFRPALRKPLDDLLHFNGW
jgi:nitroreductase